MDKRKVVFFDGYCKLCNGTINVLMNIDRKKNLYYAPLSGLTAKEFGVLNMLPKDDLSVVYYNGEGKFYFRSDAAIEIMKDSILLGKVLVCLKLIPRSLRDFIYRLIGKNRYRLFGRKESCRIPSEEEKERFLS